MRPRDIRSLLDYLRKTNQFSTLTNNLLTQWGPPNRVMLSADFLPPRLVQKNQDTIDRVHFRTVAAVDGTRYSPAQLVDSGEMFGRINYRLGHSDLARQITGPDYDGIVAYLSDNMAMRAAARAIGLFDQFIIQAMVEHDELANWEAIVTGSLTRRGDNGYFDYEGGADIAGHRVSAGGDWTDPDYDPWTGDIVPRIRFLTRLGYAREGIRVVTSDAVIQVLADHPSTVRRASNTPLPLTTEGDQAGNITDSDVARVFTKLKVQAPQTHDLRIQTKTGEKRAYPQNHMTFIASTGRNEEVFYNLDDPTQVRIVQNTLGFSGIGIANGQNAPGRRSASREYTDQKDARIEFEGWQASGPVILEPTAIADIGSIELGSD